MFSALTFNMQNGQLWREECPDNCPVDLEGTSRFLLSQNADVIFLQEVEMGHDGGHQVEPPPGYEFLKSRLTGYHSVFAYPLPNPLEIPFGLGLSIFSRTPLTGFYRLDLPPADVTFEFGGIKRHPSHRLLIGARTEIAGREVALMNTHLQAFFMIGASSDQHRTQRDLVEQHIRSLSGPALLAGDFNCAPGEGVIEQLAQAGFQTSQKTEVTWRRMPFVLDHIFFNSPLRLQSCEVIPTLTSDHHAVKSCFEFAE